MLYPLPVNFGEAPGRALVADPVVLDQVSSRRTKSGGSATADNACALQLARYLASELTVNRCANQRCRNVFTVQRGGARSDYGQHRSRGVRYCSPLCAKAQSERDRRRRRFKEAGPIVSDLLQQVRCPDLASRNTDDDASRNTREDRP